MVMPCEVSWRPDVMITACAEFFHAAATDRPGIYDILTTATYPSPFFEHAIPDDKIYRINTGAPMPLGTNAVIMVEDTRVASMNSQGDEELSVELLAQVEVGENVRKPGSDVRSGETVLSRGAYISDAGGELGTLAFVGRNQVFPILLIVRRGWVSC